MALTPEQKQAREEKLAKKAATEDEVLLREVDEAYRQEQLSSFWEKYGKALLAGIVLLLVALGAYTWWNSTREAKMEADSETIVSALDQIEAGNFDTANERLAALAGDSDGGAKAIATMLQAGIALQQDKPADAAALFEQVAADGDAPQPLRDLAQVRAMASTFDTRDPAEVIAALEPLAKPGNAFFGSAGELVAMAYLEQGKTQEAGDMFSAIARNEEVPEGIRSRARQVAGLLGFDAIEDVEKLLEEEGIDPEAGVPAE